MYLLGRSCNAHHNYSVQQPPPDGTTVEPRYERETRTIPVRRRGYGKSPLDYAEFPQIV